jgi:hypothetical protein
MHIMQDADVAVYNCTGRPCKPGQLHSCHVKSIDYVL